VLIKNFATHVNEQDLDNRFPINSKDELGDISRSISQQVLMVWETNCFYVRRYSQKYRINEAFQKYQGSGCVMLQAPRMIANSIVSALDGNASVSTSIAKNGS